MQQKLAKKNQKIAQTAKISEHIRKYKKYQKIIRKYEKRNIYDSIMFNSSGSYLDFLQFYHFFCIISMI